MNDKHNERPNYFSILPADVRYDKKLKANEKILYSEITALSNKNGYCSASNAYFAKLYQVTIRAISNWISHLERLGYVKTHLIKDKETKKVLERRIYLHGVKPVEQMFYTPRTNVPYPIEQMFQKPMEQNFQENNTSINNTSNNNSRVGEGKKEKDELKEVRKEVISYLNKTADKRFSANSNNAKKFISARYNDGYRTDDFKLVIDNKVSGWKGHEKWDKFLRPETLFGNKFESYLNEKPTKNNREDIDKIAQGYGW